MTHHVEHDRVDVVIVGSGPVGAVVAARIRAEAPDATLLMVEAAPPLGARLGEHLLASSDPTIRRRYVDRARPGNQARYVDQGAETLEAGMVPTRVLGEDVDQLSGSASSWNVGGMGIHWSAACPRPIADEIPKLYTDDEWEALIVEAERLLAVRLDVFPDSEQAEFIGGALRSLFPRNPALPGVGPMPLAGGVGTDSAYRRTGPSDIFPPIAGEPDPSFELHSGALCTSIAEIGGGVVARIRSLADGNLSEVRARVVVVAGDVLRTPQLLWASDIRPAALGRYLNEHAFLTGYTVLEHQGPRPQSEVEPFTGAWYVPTLGEAWPHQGQFMSTFVESTGGHRLGLSWYVRTDPDENNRVEFSDDDLDELGMPRMTVRFARSSADQDRIREGLRLQRSVGEAIGEFTSTGPLAPGASLHTSGSFRVGAEDDGTSTADRDGRVWGTKNVFVAGAGAIPTALACNTTLTACAIAVRTAGAVVRKLSAAGTGDRELRDEKGTPSP